jgi:cyclophilin family peptidyl-prolyl cis-trans isomerase
LSALLLALLLAGCGAKKSTSTSGTLSGGTSTAAAFPTGPTKNGCVVLPASPKLGPRKETKPTALLTAGKHYDVTLKTNCGSFSFRIDQAQSPHASASFVALVKEGFFDRTIFDRIAVGFVIQGGDPTGTQTGGPGYATVDPPPANAVYTHGVVAMAKTQLEAPGTAGSQFFVVTAPDAGLPPDYAIIGTVTKGLDVVDRIGKLGDPSQQPTMVVEIEQATVAES